MSESVWIFLGVLFISLVLMTTVLLFTRGILWARKDAAVTGTASASVKNQVHPGIDPSEYADVAEQQAALDRLAELPQFRRLAGGTLAEWGSGATITPCDCRLPPFPHLMVSWGPDHAQAIVTRQGLAHYLAYHERVAGSLQALPTKEAS
jgi:hypothetical protein